MSVTKPVIESVVINKALELAKKIMMWLFIAFAALAVLAALVMFLGNVTGNVPNTIKLLAIRRCPVIICFTNTAPKAKVWVGRPAEQ